MQPRIRSLFFVMTLTVAGPVAATVAAGEQQVRELFEVMHMQETLGQMNVQMAGLMQKKLPCVPASYWQDYIDSDGAKTVMDRMLPVFQRHFSAEEIDGLLTFYRSPLGQKVLTEMPAAMTEAMDAGQQWGQERTRSMLDELRQQGKLDAQGRCPAAQPADEPPVKTNRAPAKKSRRRAPAHKMKPAAKSAAPSATKPATSSSSSTSSKPDSQP